MDPSMMRDIPMPTSDQAAMTLADVEGTYLPIVQLQAQTIARLQAHGRDFERAFTELGAQNRALMLRVIDLERQLDDQRVADVAEEVQRKNGRSARAVEA